MRHRGGVGRHATVGHPGGSAPDSLEKIEREMGLWMGRVDPDVLRDFANRLRALRERDEKRWGMVREIEDALWNLPGTAVEEQARWLREAREGRDA